MFDFEEGEIEAIIQKFDRRELALRRKRSERVYICDCKESNIEFFGEDLVPKRTSNFDRPYQPVPTQIDEDGCCTHCGHYAYHGFQSDIEDTLKRKEARRKRSA